MNLSDEQIKQLREAFADETAKNYVIAEPKKFVPIFDELLRLRAERELYVDTLHATNRSYDVLNKQLFEVEAERNKLATGLKGAKEWREAWRANELLDKMDAADEILKGFE